MRQFFRMNLMGAAALTLAGFAAAAVTDPAAAAGTSTYSYVSIENGEKAESVTLQGSVAEIYGNFFILQGSERALIDLGPEGENGALVRLNEALTVEGKKLGGVVHACKLTFSDGRSVELKGLPAPPAPPIPPAPPAPPPPPPGVAGGPTPPAPPAPPAPPPPPPPPPPPFACDAT